jgi:hypothetical protein
VAAKYGVDRGSLRGRSGVVDGSNGMLFWGKVFVLFVSPGSFRYFYCSGRRTAVFERVSRFILCMDGLRLDGYVVEFIG